MLNNSGNQSIIEFGNSDGDDISSIVLLVTKVLYTLVCIVGLLGNTLVITVVLRFSKMQTVTNMYILNLALADECFLVGIPFLLVNMIMGYWPFGNLACKVYFATTGINQFTSTLFLTVMSADRYVAICHPISATTIRIPVTAKIVSVLMWVISSLLVIPIFMHAKSFEYRHKIKCNIVWPRNTFLDGQQTFIIYCFVAGFAIPVLLMLIFYFGVLRKLKLIDLKSHGTERKKSHRKVTRLVFVVVSAYIFCWLPYWSMQLTIISQVPEKSQSSLMIVFHLVAGILSYSNSAMNPILYTFLSENFKKSFSKVCVCTVRNSFGRTSTRVIIESLPKKSKSNQTSSEKSSRFVYSNETNQTFQIKPILESPNGEEMSLSESGKKVYNIGPHETHL